MKDTDVCWANVGLQQILIIVFPDILRLRIWAPNGHCLVTIHHWMEVKVSLFNKALKGKWLLQGKGSAVWRKSEFKNQKENKNGQQKQASEGTIKHFGEFTYEITLLGSSSAGAFAWKITISSQRFSS